jgi:predicted secreted Zn-dependent protease
MMLRGGSLLILAAVFSTGCQAGATASNLGTSSATPIASPPAVSTAIASTHPTSSGPTLPPPQPTTPTREPTATPLPSATPVPSASPIPLPSPLPGVSVAKKTHYYDIAGLTTSQLVDAMEHRAALHSPDGFWAGTRFEWNAHWDFHQNGKCRRTAVSVSVRTFMTLPRWSMPADADPSVVTRWEGFMDALTLHEAGHVAIGIQTGNEILMALEKVPPKATCNRLVSALRRALDRAAESGEARNTEYDRVTIHGRTQGAVFP